MSIRDQLKENMAFLEEYKAVDSFLRDAYGTETGITAYLSAMEHSAAAGRSAVASWDADYRRLKHLRWVRNQLAHEQGFDAPVGDSADFDWLERFHRRLLHGEDPLARLSHAQRQRKNARPAAPQRRDAGSPNRPVRAHSSPKQRKKERNPMKKALRILLALLVALLLALGAYVAYAMLTYYRLEDYLPLEVTGGAEETLTAGAEIDFLSWNIGFGAYEPDFSFFMDGGQRSWAWSEERLTKNLDKIGAFLQAQKGDIVLLQEVDIDATRTYHVNELERLTPLLNAARDYCGVFAQNYDSPFLFYPFTQPHGATKAGIATFSAYPIASALRRSVPVETGLTKFIDLDRCYDLSRIPVEGGGELVVYNVHLSAYTSDGTIAVEQLAQLLEDMEAEYRQGNWCIAGGDFNKDLLGGENWFGNAEQAYTWAQPIPEGTFDGYHITLQAPLDPENPVPTTRNTDRAWHEGQYVLTVDGYLVSENVEVLECGVVDTDFAYSDHNPVRLRVALS